MKLSQVRVALIAIAAVLAIAAGASTIKAASVPDVPHSAPIVLQQEGGHSSGENTASTQAQNGGGGINIVKVSIWTVVGIAIGGLVLAIFYMLKRRLGGFPEDAAWVAPITIMESKDFPDEGTFGDQEPSLQAHAEH